MRSIPGLVLGCLMIAGLTVACGEPEGPNGAITLYSGQHEELSKELGADFERESGIKVHIRKGGDLDLANQIIQEGESSRADVFITENSPALTLVDGKNGFVTLDDATLAQVEPRFAPSSRNWVGWAARSAVLVYNKSMLTPEQLPASLMDLQKPEWKDRVGAAAAGADFQAIVSAVLATKGEQATAQWLTGLKNNARIYRNNIATMKAVNAGEVPAGVIYHYYWYRDQARTGADSKNTELRFFTDGDPGAFLSVSGAAVVKASEKQDKARQFVKYLSGPRGQEILARSQSMEYPIGSDKANNRLKPLSQLRPPTIDIGTLNGPKVVDLMRAAGLL